MKTINLTLQELQQTPQTGNMKNITPRNIQIILLQTSDKQKILQEEGKKKKTVCTEDDSRFLVGKQCKQENSGTTSLKVLND